MTTVSPVQLQDTDIPSQLRSKGNPSCVNTALACADGLLHKALQSILGYCSTAINDFTHVSNGSAKQCVMSE